MNRLPTAKRVQILGMLMEGMSQRGAARQADVDRGAVAKLALDAGNASASYHHEHVRGLTGGREIECDEMWSFVYAKEKNLAEAKAAPNGAGNIWTWIALDRETKLIVSYLLSDGRDADSGIQFMLDLARRLTRTPIVLTDQLPSYVEAAQWVFGMKAKHVQGKTITNHVERWNLTLRMGLRRFIRRTNGFSKRLEYHAAMVALYILYYNWCRVHGSLRVTPAMAAGLTPTIHDLEWVVDLVNARAAKPNRPRTYRKHRKAS